VPVAGHASAAAALNREAVQAAVRDHYAAAALNVTTDERGDGGCTETGIGSGCYPAGALTAFRPAAVAASICCANPVAVAELAEGEVVLDLGSGGGIDVLLSARRVGPTGTAYGLDMTEEMLAGMLKMMGGEPEGASSPHGGHAGA